MDENKPETSKIKNVAWVFKGLSAFGLCVGLYVGMSISPIVNSVVSLMFASIGGSVIFLLKGREEDELNLIGISIFVLSVAMIVGSVIGVVIREGGIGGSEKDVLTIDKKEFVGFVIQLSKDKVDQRKICSLVKRFKKENNFVIDKNDIKSIADDKSKVKDLVFAAMLDSSIKCFEGDTVQSSSGGLVLHSGRIE